MKSTWRRRIFGVASAACLAAIVSERAVLAAETFTLRAAKPDAAPWRVTVNLEVGGQLKAAGESKRAESIPMSVVARLGYDEQRLDDGGNDDFRIALRYYDELDAVIKTNSQITKPELRDSRRLIAATADKKRVNLLSPSGPLTRDELELIDIPANTLVLDELLPENEVQLGDAWKPADVALARLLGLDAVGHSEVECRLVAVSNGVAEITVDGTLGGAINGVASDIELKAKLLYDVQRHIPQSLTLAIKEQRGIGNVGPGLDVVAKIKLTVAPLSQSRLLASEAAQAAKPPKSSEAPPLEFRSAAKGYRFLYDRRWHITREEPDLIVLRLVDRGDLIAQCNIAPSIRAIDKPVELTQFQEDVQKGLGPLFGSFQRAGQRPSEPGLRILESVAIGSAEQLPIEWHYYLVHDGSGRALTAIFTMEGPLAKQFGNQDKLIVESVEFLEPTVAEAKPAAAKQ